MSPAIFVGEQPLVAGAALDRCIGGVSQGSTLATEVALFARLVILSGTRLSVDRRREAAPLLAAGPGGP